MRYQERIQIKNQNSAIRNKGVLNVNMSSDFCVFETPTYNIENFMEIQCSGDTFTLSGYSFNDILSAATYNCFGTGSTSCYTSTTWSTVIYENGNPSYSGSFYTTSFLSGDTPPNSAFTLSIQTAFNTLNYSYTQSGSTYYVDKPYGVNTLDIDVCVNIEKSNYTGTCSGYCFDYCATINTLSFPYIDNTTTGVYIIPLTGTTFISVLIDFTNNLQEINNLENLTFWYEIYKYDQNLGVFAQPSVYKSENISYESYTGCVETYLKYAEAVGITEDPGPFIGENYSSPNELLVSILTEIGCSDLFVPWSGLTGDGDYILKIYYEFDACTDFLKRLGKKIDTSNYDLAKQYQLYDSNFDKYFVGVNKADIPIFTPTIGVENTDINPLPLFQQTIIADDTFTSGITGSTFGLVSDIFGDTIVTLNGLALSKNIDYTISGNVLTLYGTVKKDDIISIIFTRSIETTIATNTILIDTPITSGATNTQGSNNYFYNTTKQKYEVYLETEPIDGSEIILILNGLILTNNIDYYRSISNKKRIILEGTLSFEDIVTIIYYPKATIVNGINQNTNTINWYIENEPQNNLGQFTIEYGTDSMFSTFLTGNTVQHQQFVSNYSSTLTLTGSVGTQIYYRVKNHKKYQSICGDIIDDIAYSEVIPVVIQSNSINSY